MRLERRTIQQAEELGLGRLKRRYAEEGVDDIIHSRPFSVLFKSTGNPLDVVVCFSRSSLRGVGRSFYKFTGSDEAICDFRKLFAEH
jgi:hypothetical protein